MLMISSKCPTCLFFFYDSGPLVWYIRKVFRKTNISNFLIHIGMCVGTRAYQWIRNVSFSENFVYVLNR